MIMIMKVMITMVESMIVAKMFINISVMLMMIIIIKMKLIAITM